MIWLLLLIPISLQAITIRIVNDSDYLLEALVSSKNGTDLGTMSFPPRMTNNFSIIQSPFSQKRAEPPFRVIFKCPSGSIYGTWYDVPSGATINATGSIGSHKCKPQKSIPKKTTGREPSSSPLHLLYLTKEIERSTIQQSIPTP